MRAGGTGVRGSRLEVAPQGISRSMTAVKCGLVVLLYGCGNENTKKGGGGGSEQDGSGARAQRPYSGQGWWVHGRGPLRPRHARSWRGGLLWAKRRAQSMPVDALKSVPVRGLALHWCSQEMGGGKGKSRSPICTFSGVKRAIEEEGGGRRRRRR